MRLPALHARLLTDVLAVGSSFPLVITGGYAVQAHRLIDRPSQDLDVATENPAPMGRITEEVAAGLNERGWQVQVVEVAPLSARLLVTERSTGAECEVDVLKEVFYRPAVPTEYGPVLSEQDVLGTKVRALADRGAPRDALDAFAAADRWTVADLESFGRRHARDEFDLDELHMRLESVGWMQTSDFTVYGVDDETVHRLRAWVQEWADDIAARLQGGED